MGLGFMHLINILIARARQFIPSIPSLGKNCARRSPHTAAPYMVSAFVAGKSSAKHLAPRVFSQKSFVESVFGHFFCPFSENFFDSCAK